MHMQTAWFIRWSYHQLSKDERHSLKEWPESDVAKALMYDSPLGQTAPPNVNVILPLPEDATLVNSVIVGLHHVHLAKEAVCDIPGFARAGDPREYDSLQAGPPGRLHRGLYVKLQGYLSYIRLREMPVFLQSTFRILDWNGSEGAFLCRQNMVRLRK
jgi:hypothetical protein